MTDTLERREAISKATHAVSDDALANLAIRSPLNRAIYAAIRGYRMGNMCDADDHLSAYPLVDLMSNPAPDDIGTGEMEMVALADEVESAILALTPSPRVDEGRAREVLAEGYKALSGKRHHASDCATSRAPAEEPGPCDCSFDGDKDLAEQLVEDFNGGLIRLDDPSNVRGYSIRFQPVAAMRYALSKAALATTPAPREMEADLVEAKAALERILDVRVSRDDNIWAGAERCRSIARVTLAKLDRSAGEG